MKENMLMRVALKWIPSSPSEPYQTLKLKVIYWEVFFSGNFTSSLTVLVSVFIFYILAWKRMPFFFHSILCLGIETEFWGGVKSARDFPGSASGKELACQSRRCKTLGFNPWVKEIPWRRAWQPTPVFLPGESHGQKGLVGYGLWGRKESQTWLKRLSMHAKSVRNIWT